MKKGIKVLSRGVSIREVAEMSVCCKGAPSASK